MQNAGTSLATELNGIDADPRGNKRQNMAHDNNCASLLGVLAKKRSQKLLFFQCEPQKC